MTKEVPLKETISAGGIIIKKEDGDIKLLLLRDKRHGSWFLPKGHVRDYETLEEGALREIHEETGLRKLKVIKHLGSASRNVIQAGEHKTIHYFLMIHEDPTEELNPLDPDAWDEGYNESIEAVWHSLDIMPIIYTQEQVKIIIDNLDFIRSQFDN